MKCGKETGTNYYYRDCILGTCKNKCRVTNIANDLCGENDLNISVSYYIFSNVATSYFNTAGKKVVYNRTTRVDKHESLSSVIMELQHLSQKYLLHRFNVSNDNYYWKLFLETTESYVLWLDYSQNIKLTEKNQVQSAHFSGRQHTLHNTVLRSPNGGIKYIYHLSDDTNHDVTMTFYIIEDIIKTHPEIINKTLVLRSENCQDQYKSKYTFAKLKMLAQKYQIVFAWFYGEAGHGRGLVDAMSSFGYKQQLKYEIVANDGWFPGAIQMVQYLSKYFESDQNKEYHFIDQEYIAALRRDVQTEELPIHPCRVFHLFAFNKDGDYIKELYFRNPNFKTIFQGKINDNEVSTLEMNLEETHTDSWSLITDSIYELVEPGTFVGLRSPSNSVEPFFVAEILNKNIATDAMMDDFGHAILAGEKYAEIIYLDSDIGKKKIKYLSGQEGSSKFLYTWMRFSLQILH